MLTNFKTLFLANKSVASTAAEEPSEGLLEQQVANTPNGIGFLSNYRADQGTVNPVAYNGVACTLANIASGQYTATARFYEVTKGPATGAGRQVHLVDQDQQGRTQDHLDPVGSGLEPRR